MSHSFAWGLAPSAARAQVALKKLGGCTVTDTVWKQRLLEQVPRGIHAERDDDARTCVFTTNTSLVPKLLLNECLICLSGKLLQFRDMSQTFSTPPVASVQTALTSSEYPPNFWLVSILACFPCPGTPMARCVQTLVLLDASHVHRSRVLAISDAGVVPAEEAFAGSLVPSNSLVSETLIHE